MACDQRGLPYVLEASVFVAFVSPGSVTMESGQRRVVLLHMPISELTIQNNWVALSHRAPA